MKVYGYSRTDYRKSLQDYDFEPPLLEMNEVSFVANPEALRKIAEFLVSSANDIERHQKDFGHNHLSSFWSGWQKDFCDVIVCNEERLG